jgi:hypothetical protein
MRQNGLGATDPVWLLFSPPADSIHGVPMLVNIEFQKRDDLER